MLDSNIVHVKHPHFVNTSRSFVFYTLIKVDNIISFGFVDAADYYYHYYVFSYVRYPIENFIERIEMSNNLNNRSKNVCSLFAFFCC